MKVKQKPFAINATDDTDRVPPIQGTTHADEPLHCFGGLVPGWKPALVSAHWKLRRLRLAAFVDAGTRMHPNLQRLGIGARANTVVPCVKVG